MPEWFSHGLVGDSLAALSTAGRFFCLEPLLLPQPISIEASSQAFVGQEDDEEDHLPIVIDRGVATVFISGLLRREMSVWRWLGYSRQSTSSEIVAAIEKAESSAEVERILYVIESPGGTCEAGFEVAQAAWKARQSKDSTAYIPSMGASAAYWIASQSHRVLGSRIGQAGSLGTFFALLDTSERSKELGLRGVVRRSAAFKGVGVAGTPITAEMEADLDRQVAEMNSVFLEDLARARPGLTTERVAELNGRVYLGKSALEAGLLDQVVEGGEIHAAMGIEPSRPMLSLSNQGGSPPLKGEHMPETTPPPEAPATPPAAPPVAPVTPPAQASAPEPHDLEALAATVQGERRGLAIEMAEGHVARQLASIQGAPGKPEFITALATLQAAESKPDLFASDDLKGSFGVILGEVKALAERANTQAAPGEEFAFFESNDGPEATSTAAGDLMASAQGLDLTEADLAAAQASMAAMAGA